MTSTADRLAQDIKTLCRDIGAGPGLRDALEEISRSRYMSDHSLHTVLHGLRAKAVYRARPISSRRSLRRPASAPRPRRSRRSERGRERATRLLKQLPPARARRDSDRLLHTLIWKHHREGADGPARNAACSAPRRAQQCSWIHASTGVSKPGILILALAAGDLRAANGASALAQAPLQEPTPEARCGLDAQRDKASAFLLPSLDRLLQEPERLAALEAAYKRDCWGFLNTPLGGDDTPVQLSGTPACLSQESTIKGIQTRLCNSAPQLKTQPRRVGFHLASVGSGNSGRGIAGNSGQVVPSVI